MIQYNNTMFESIKSALNKQQKNTGTRDLLTFEKGNTYIVRLLPNIKDPEKTWFKYQIFGWTSFATGQYVQSVSPLSWGERDPIAEERIKIYKSGTEAEKEKVKNIRRSDRWVMRVYVISDPTNAENNGKVKLIRFGKQLQKIIDAAISGDDADEFGERIFDLSPNGVNFKIKVTDQGGFANYTESRFTSPIDLKLSNQDIETIYNTEMDLDTVYTSRSYEELKSMLDEHYYTSTAYVESETTVGEDSDEVTGDDREAIKRMIASIDEE